MPSGIVFLMAGHAEIQLGEGCVMRLPGMMDAGGWQKG